MKVAVFGGTGFVGRNLTQALLANGYQVLIVTRNSRRSFTNPGNEVQTLQWQTSLPLSSLGELKDVDAIVNLAGESIGNRRWTNSVKQEILNSRIRITQAIVKAINDGEIKPRVLINASAVGFYGPHADEEITEAEEAGQDFLAQVCREWENAAYKVQDDQTRVVTLRLGVVLGKEGALKRMLLPFRFYIGGPLGNGKQWMSWMHIRDLTRMMIFVLEHPELNGPLNATAPEPMTMKSFCDIIGHVLSKPSWLPVPEFVLRLGLGQMAEMLLHGQRVVPKRVTDAGFVFRFPKLAPAIEDVVKMMSSQTGV